MVVDPMGVARLDLGPYPGVAVAEIDTGLTDRVRAELPCLQHRRPDVFGG
jgi:predicted amidohydrolase